jgi:hypothetical protein
MERIVICHLDGFKVPEEIIKESLELNEAIKDHSNTFSEHKIWKQEKNYIIHEDGIEAAFFENDLKTV